MSPEITASRWAMVASTLIRKRDELRWLTQAGEDCGVYNTPEQRALYDRAANALGPFIAEAMRNKREIDQQIEAKRPKAPEYISLTDAEFAELGAAMAANPTEITSNIDGLAFLHERDRQKREAIARDGCCGGEATADGVCYGIGKCPRHFEAQSAVNFVTGYLQWLDDLQEQSGLAAVAARLSVPCSLIDSEVSNVQ